MWFWLGSQGYEYVDLGRLWQILLFVGLTFWLWLMWRGIKPALARHDENHSLLMLFLISSIAIPLFYAAGLMYGQRSPLISAEYWRWWVVHLWVEGFFEVFATVVIAFLLTRLKLLSVPTATRSVLVFNRDLPLRRNHRDFPSPLFHRHAQFRSGVGSGVQRLGSSATGADWLRGVGEHPPDARHRRQSLDQRLQVADLLLHRGGVLEFRRSGTVRLHDQSTHRALLRAGTQPDSRARTRGAVRGIRHAGSGPDAVLPARAAAGSDVERPSASDRILVDQYRIGRHDLVEHAPDRIDAGLGLRRIRHMVCALLGVHANADRSTTCDGCACSAIRCSPSVHLCSAGLSWDSSPGTPSTTRPRSTKENTRRGHWKRSTSATNSRSVAKTTLLGLLPSSIFCWLR